MQGQHSSICPTPRNAAYADSLAPRSGVALAARLAAAVAAAAAASSDFAGFDADAALLRGAAVLGAAAAVCCFFSFRSRSRRCWG